METPTGRISHSHLFPGATIHVSQRSLPDPAEVLLIFSDDSLAEGTLTRHGWQLLLEVDAYRTAAGTPVGSKSWEVSDDGDGSLRVSGRAAPRG